MVKCKYTIPAKPAGTTQALLVKGTKAAVPDASPPATNAHSVAPVAAVVTGMLVPAGIVAGRAAVPAVRVRAGKGVMAKLAPAGQLEMKPAARVKTARIPSGVSNALGMAVALDAVRMNVWWRDSTVTISAATVRIPADLTRGAAAR